MKKILSILIIFTMIFSMTSCGNEKSDMPNISESQSISEITEESTSSGQNIESEPDKIKENIEAYIYQDSDDFKIENMKIEEVKQICGTQNDVEKYTKQIEDLKLADITRIYATDMPSFFSANKVSITPKEAESIVTTLKNFKISTLSKEEYEELLMGGGWSIYIETKDSAYTVFWNGESRVFITSDKDNISVALKNDNDSCVEMHKILCDLMNKYLEVSDNSPYKK